MRYDTPVFFQRVLPGEYDSKTGNYAADQVTEVQKMASVMDTRAEIMQIVYGGIRQGSVTVQLQNHYQKPFDRIRIGNTTYRVDYTRKLRVKQTVGGGLMPKIKLEGMEKLQVKLKKNVQMSDIKRVVKENGKALQEASQRKAPVDTGTLKRSIGLEIRDGGLTAEV